MTLRDPYARHRPWFDVPVRRHWPGMDAGPAPRATPRPTPRRTPWQRHSAAEPEPLSAYGRRYEEEPPAAVDSAVEVDRDDPVPEAVQAVPASDPGVIDGAIPSPPAEVGHPGIQDREQLNEALRELTAAKQRVERDAQRVKDETRGALIADLLPVLDNLDRSLEVEATDSALHDGVKLVRHQLEQVLLGYGLERIEGVGQVFDPSLHEAVAVVSIDRTSQDGVVQDEWQAGYRFGDKVLRAAKVSVGKHAADHAAGQPPMAAE